MSIAALGSTWLLSMATNALTGATGNKASSTSSTQTTGSANIGDAFQLSLSSAMMSAPPPPPPPAGERVSLKNDIGDFLTKVANGTVSSTDLQQMQDKLQQAAQNGGVQGHHRHRWHGEESADQNNQIAASGIGVDLRAFLEKLLTGTATDDDFKSIEEKITALNTATGISATNSSTVSSANEILRVSGVSRALLNSAMDAYNDQAYFSSSRVS